MRGAAFLPVLRADGTADAPARRERDSRPTEDRMPDMLAHYLVAEQAARRLDGTDAARLVAGAWDAYKVGAQGPDVFFYSNLLRRRGRPDLAHLTHRHRMSAAFRSLLGLRRRAARGRAPGRLRLRRRVRGAPVPGRRGAPVGALLDRRHHRRGRPGGQGSRRFAGTGCSRRRSTSSCASEQGGGPDWLRRRRLLRLPAPQSDDRRGHC